MRIRFCHCGCATALALLGIGLSFVGSAYEVQLSLVTRPPAGAARERGRASPRVACGRLRGLAAAYKVQLDLAGKSSVLEGFVAKRSSLSAPRHAAPWREQCAATIAVAFVLR